MRFPSICTLALHRVAETLSIPAPREGNKKTLTDWVRVLCGAYNILTFPASIAAFQLLTPYTKYVAPLAHMEGGTPPGG